MRKTISLFLVMTMIFSTLFAVTVSADAVNITLSRNKTFITEVDETKSLIVTPLDENGEEGALPEGTTLTYESSRPWVLSIADDGKFIDGDYDGTTKITVKASNGMEASTIFIKNSNNAYADWSYATGDSTDHYGGDFVGSRADGSKIRYRGTWVDGKRRFNVNAEGVSEEDKATAKIPGENYYKLATTAAAPNLDNTIVSGYDNLNDAAKAAKAGWYNEGLRVLQGWFYDDGVSAVHLKTYMSQSSNYLNGESHLNWETDIKAVENSDVYSVVYHHNVDESSKVYHEIKRSKGWHQATIIMDNTKTFEMYIDGELLASAKAIYKAISSDLIAITGASAGNFDEFVVAANPNTTKPDDYFYPAESITLSRNKTFITSVDETASLIVTGLDENGVEGAVLPEGTTFTYESSRPWVLDIAEDGKFLDGGYDGTTKITVTASNGMKASTIFIKNSNNDYANYSYATGDSTDHYDNVDPGVGKGLGYRGTYVDGKRRFDVNAEGVSEADKAAAKIPGQNYYKLGTANADPYTDYTIVTGYDRLVKNSIASTEKLGWYKEGLRVQQAWFYDDGTSPVHVRSLMSQHSDYLTGALTGSLGSGVSHLFWIADITAKSGADNYSFKNTHSVTNETINTIKRSKGWHQVTTILNDNMTVDVMIDGELLGSSKNTYNTDSRNHGFYIACASVGNFDELVVAANPNTTKPTVNITVSYDEAKGSVSCNDNTVVNGGKAECYYDGSVNFTFEPKEGYELDTVTYDGKEVTAFIKDGVLSVDCKNAELVVTFKEKVIVAPAVSKTVEINTDKEVNGHPAALMFMQIQPGYGFAVTEAGIVISDRENNSENGIKLVALTQDKTNVTSGMFGIRVFGEALTGTKCYYKPFISYQKDGQTQTDYSETEDSFTLTEKN